MSETNTAEAVERATPRPWVQSEFGKGASVFGPTPAHHFIAAANSLTQPHGTNIANAALIVAAVNAYDENREEITRPRSRIMELEGALGPALDTLQAFLDTFGDLGDRVTQADINDWARVLKGEK